MVASLVLIGGQMVVPGTFVLLPFGHPAALRPSCCPSAILLPSGIGAAVAALLSILGVDTGWTWVVEVQASPTGRRNSRRTDRWRGSVGR